MKGLELSRRFFEAYGKEALEKEFSEVLPRLAIGLAGEGSECFGFDDDISQDHDFEPAFCIWLSRADYEKYGFALERSYSRLPREFEGYSRSRVSPVGGSRHGVICTEEFFEKFLGTPSLPTSLLQWLYIPTSSLACASNGEVFYDGAGDFSAVRDKLRAGFPEDVRLKKIAACATLMSQSGLYNYPRAIERGESGTAQLCIFEFVRHTISMIYLLNNKFEPFYKWAYRGMRSLRLGKLEASLVALTELGNSRLEAEAKRESIEEICLAVIGELRAQMLTDVCEDEIEAHAVSVQNRISDSSLRNMHILEGI